MNDYTAVNSFDQGETFKSKTEEWFEQSGILGQKWGIRRYQNPDGSLTPAGRARYGRAERKAEKQAAKQAKRDALKEEITKRRGISRSDIKNMSDQDLNSAINRKQRENQYYDLMHPEEAKAREFTNKALNTLMSSALEVGSKVGKEYAEKALKKSLGLTDDEAEKLQKEMNKVKLEQNKLNLQVTKNNIKKTELDNKQKERDLKKAKQEEIKNTINKITKKDKKSNTDNESDEVLYYEVPKKVKANQIKGLNSEEVNSFHRISSYTDSNGKSHSRSDVIEAMHKHAAAQQRVKTSSTKKIKTIKPTTINKAKNKIDDYWSDIHVDDHYLAIAKGLVSNYDKNR